MGKTNKTVERPNTHLEDFQEQHIIFKFLEIMRLPLFAFLVTVTMLFWRTSAAAIPISRPSPTQDSLGLSSQIKQVANDLKALEDSTRARFDNLSRWIELNRKHDKEESLQTLKQAKGAIREIEDTIRRMKQSIGKMDKKSG